MVRKGISSQILWNRQKRQQMHICQPWNWQIEGEQKLLQHPAFFGFTEAAVCSAGHMAGILNLVSGWSSFHNGDTKIGENTAGIQYAEEQAVFGPVMQRL